MDNNIKLLDCTLGLGGELISWKYLENNIEEMLRLLMQSRMDIVEYGILSNYPKGPNYSIYDSTVLPPTFRKHREQHVALMLDVDGYYPSIDSLPQNSATTADIIRVKLTKKNKDEALTYCQALAGLGYPLMMMIDEVGQYSEAEIGSLLEEVNRYEPMSVCLADTSGVLEEAELLELIRLCDETLAQGIGVGFHGCDNKCEVLDLVKAICRLDIFEHRELIFDTGIAGMGIGPLNLASEKVAMLLNEEKGASYELSILNYLTRYTSQYTESKEDYGAIMLYKAAADARCSYKYVEYYCELGVDASLQMDVYAAISRDAAFCFSRNEANTALMRNQKRILDIVIIIVTADRTKAVDYLLFHSAKELLRFGAEIVIYDSSKDDSTYAATLNFQIDGYNNIHYRRCTSETSDLSIDSKVLAACSEFANHKYVWVCGDEYVPTLQQFYMELVGLTEQGIDLIAVDWTQRNFGRRCVKQYDNCVDFFSENMARTSRLGCLIYKGSFLSELIKAQPVAENNYGFWVPVAALHQMADKPVSCGQIISNVFFYDTNEPKSYGWVKNMFEKWGEGWYRVITGLPAIYDSEKSSVLKSYTSDFRPFSVRSLLHLRAIGGYNLSIYEKNRDLLAKISDNPGWKFTFVALLPKTIARLILYIDKRRSSPKKHSQ